MQWGGGDEVFIQTPTGSGKTTFILEVLAKCAVEKSKEVLLLVNRRLLKAQICQELAREHGVLIHLKRQNSMFFTNMKMMEKLIWRNSGLILRLCGITPEDAISMCNLKK